METLEEYYRADYQRLVKRYWFKTGNWHIAEDIVQETFCRMLEAGVEGGSMEDIFNSHVGNSRRDVERDDRQAGMTGRSDVGG